MAKRPMPNMASLPVRRQWLSRAAAKFLLRLLYGHRAAGPLSPGAVEHILIGERLAVNASAPPVLEVSLEKMLRFGSQPLVL